MKYTPKGGTIAISARVAPDVGGDRFDLRILDSGPGIPDAHKATIFDKYGQLDRDAQTHARVSRGVGLAFCRHAVAAHGGTIAVEDNQPRGSVFVVRLPMKGP